MHVRTSNEWLIRQPPDNELDHVSSVLDDGDGIRVEHVLCVVAVDLKQFITYLHK